MISRRRPNRRQVVTFLLSFAFGLLFSTYVIKDLPQKQKVIKNYENDVFISCDNFAASEQTYRSDDPKARREKSRELENFYETIDDGRNFVEAVKVTEEVMRVPNQCKFGSENKSVRVEVSASKEENFLYVGVMTAGKYINTRGRAICDTWKRHIPGSVEFYVGENAQFEETNVTNIHYLTTVDDNTYPPQKKSFMMLRNMYKQYIDSGHEWFMRADDDVYVNAEKLEKMLRKMNSSKPIVLGQAGIGNDEERGSLSLQKDENYCMGGPGVIMSREALRLVGSKVQQCMSEMYTWHEDVEISRCLKKFAGINCPWTYEVKQLFYEHYIFRKGYIDAWDETQNSKLTEAATMHPNKKPTYQLKLHHFMLSHKIKQLQEQLINFKRELYSMANFTHHEVTTSETAMGKTPSLRRFQPKKGREVIKWDMFTDRIQYSHENPGRPRRSNPSPQQFVLRNIVKQVVDKILKTEGRKVEFRHINYGYRRVVPLYGPEYILDVVLSYKRGQGKSINVRKHAYAVQTFSRCFLREQEPLKAEEIKSILKPIRSIVQKVKFMLGLESVQSYDVCDKNDAEAALFEAKTSSKMRYSHLRRLDSETVNIIVPLSGRLKTFKTFMRHLEATSLSKGDKVSLLVVLFDQFPDQNSESNETISLVQQYKKAYPDHNLELIKIEAKFSRGAGLELGASHFGKNSLLFFCDVDVFFTAHFLEKCRRNAEMGRRVFYPVLFSEFSPSFSRVKSGWQRAGKFTIEDFSASLSQSLSDDIKPRADHFHFGERAGFWRSYGYGMLCVYQDDFIKSGGFDSSIRGWGVEDER